MKTNLIVLTKEKLITIDAIIPVLMELKAEHPECNILIILPSLENLDLVKKNVHLWQCIKELNPLVLAPRRDNKLFIAMFIGKLFFKLFLSRNIIIKFGDTLFKHRSFMMILKMISKTVEIRTIIHSPVVSAVARRACQWGRAYNNDSGEYNFGSIFDEGDDYLLTSIRDSDLKNFYEPVPYSTYIYLGYPKALPKWKKFLEKTVDIYPPINQGDYFLFILSTMKKRLDALDEPAIETLLEESLQYLKRYNDKIHTIFRPHPVTDIATLEDIIEKTDYKNYSIDYGHPMALASKAKFCILNTYSTTMNDAYFQGIPIIEYCSYDKDLTKRWNQHAKGWKYSDYFIDRDPEKLVSVVSSILNSKVKIKRDPKFIDENFPETPDRTFKFFDELINEN